MMSFVLNMMNLYFNSLKMMINANVQGRSSKHAWDTMTMRRLVLSLAGLLDLTCRLGWSQSEGFKKRNLVFVHTRTCIHTHSYSILVAYDQR